MPKDNGVAFDKAGISGFALKRMERALTEAILEYNATHLTPNVLPRFEYRDAERLRNMLTEALK